MKLDESNDRSFLLDVLRAVSAQIVCIGHALSYSGLYPDELPYLQNLGVCIFFVLSGFLIAHVLQSAPSFAGFVVDRASRIYTAYLPALVLIFAANAWLVTHGNLPAIYAQWDTLLLNLGMLQMWTGPWPEVRSTVNLTGPLWSVAIEWYIYIFVGAAWFALKGRLAALPFVILFAWVAKVYLFGDQQPGLGTGLFSLWLAGFGVHFVLRSVPIGWPVATAMLVASLSFLARIMEKNVYDLGVYACLAVAFLFLMVLTGRTTLASSLPFLRKAARFGALYSFSLYLLHHSVLQIGDAVFVSGGPREAVTGIIVSNILAIVFALAIEKHYKTVRTWLRTFVGPRPVPAE